MATLQEQIKKTIERVRNAEWDVQRVRASYTTPHPITAKYADLYDEELATAEKELSKLLEKIEK